MVSTVMTENFLSCSGYFNEGNIGYLKHWIVLQLSLLLLVYFYTGKEGSTIGILNLQFLSCKYIRSKEEKFQPTPGEKSNVVKVRSSSWIQVRNGFSETTGIENILSTAQLMPQQGNEMGTTSQLYGYVRWASQKLNECIKPHI